MLHGYVGVSLRGLYFSDGFFGWTILASLENAGAGTLGLLP